MTARSCHGMQHAWSAMSLTGTNAHDSQGHLQKRRISTVYHLQVQS